MKPEIIVMLTHNDVTVENAREIFKSAAELPVQYWGLKDVGLETTEMEKLVRDFKDAGKSAVLEVVSFDDSEILEAAALAVECGIEYFTGASFSRAAMDKVHAAGMKYFPFCGDVGGSPIKLSGTPEQVRDDALRTREAGADGIDLVAYRYADGDAVDLAKLVVEEVGAENLIVAGSINSVDRMKRMHEIGPFGYTMGGALFEAVFKPGASFAENLAEVVRIDQSLVGSSR